MAMVDTQDAGARRLRLELDDLRRNQLHIVLPAMLVLSWVWVFLSVWRYGLLVAVTLPPLLLMFATYPIYLILRRSVRGASWALVLAALGAHALHVLTVPEPLSVMFGLLAVLVASGLLSTWIGAGVAAAAWLIGVHLLAPDAPLALAGGAQLALLYALVWFGSLVLSQASTDAVGWAVTGWRRAHAALAQAQDRQAELYRVLRALEEATYRIERMNNELLIAQREAETARAAKAKLLATVSHELRGPLNLILGFTRLMTLAPETYGEALPRAYRADMRAVHRNTEHLVALLNDILDLSQIEAERLPLVKDRVELVPDVLQKTLEIVRPLAERRGLFLRLEAEPTLPWLLADPVRLRQALLNLLNNAVRFTDRGGITVGARREGDYIAVTVADTGVGIAASQLPHLFREFQQLQPAADSSAVSSGLGLSISKHLVELHGGEMQVASREGAGTTFTMRLPLPGQALPTPSAALPDVALPMARLLATCLVVGDDVGLVASLSRHLEGYRVVGVPNLAQVAPLVAELHPHGILADEQLAPAVARALAPLDEDVPVIACRMPEGGARLDEATRFLPKPISAEGVLTVLDALGLDRDGPATVLLVDDDPDSVRLMERTLLSIPHDYQILRAYDGGEALEILQHTLPDVVFMDLVMPGVDGRETLARMRADETLRAVPVILVSAKDLEEDKLALELPLVVQRRRALDLASAARCLQRLLGELKPHYLPTPAASEPSLPAPSAQSAFAAPPPPPAPAPDLAG